MPPKSGGWTITSLPGALREDPEYDRLAWGWSNRKRSPNNNHSNAVQEMVNFLSLNSILITPELKREIRRHAEEEWCRRDPSRCPNKRPKEQRERIEMIRRAAVSAPSRGCGGCGGGRVS